MRKGYKDFNNGNIGSLLDLFADDIEWDEPDWVLGPGGEFRGKEGVKRGVFDAVPQYWERSQLQAREFIAAGDRVIVLGEFVNQLKGSSKEIRVPFAHFFKLRDGKCVKMEAYMDVKELAQVAQCARRAA